MQKSIFKIVFKPIRTFSGETQHIISKNIVDIKAVNIAYLKNRVT